MIENILHTKVKLGFKGSKKQLVARESKKKKSNYPLSIVKKEIIFILNVGRDSMYAGTFATKLVSYCKFYKNKMQSQTEVQVADCFTINK
ncbi:unnamed protein product, partial [Sphenostylis stenocarpa]